MGESVDWNVTGTIPEIYERIFVPAAIHTWASRLVDLADMRPGKRILDVACGTGAVTHLFAKYVVNGGRIVGYDISPEMIAVAQTKESPTPIEWRVGDAACLPFQDESFDIVVCQLGLMFFADRTMCLREMYRVLSLRGHLMVLVWGAIEHNPGPLAVAEGFKRYVGDEASDSIRGPFVLGDSQQIRSLADAAGLRDVTVQEMVGQAHLPSVETLVHAYGAILQPAIDKTTLTQLITDVTTALQPYVQHEELSYPIEAILMQAKK